MSREITKEEEALIVTALAWWSDAQQASSFPAFESAMRRLANARAPKKPMGAEERTADLVTLWNFPDRVTFRAMCERHIRAAESAAWDRCVNTALRIREGQSEAAARLALHDLRGRCHEAAP